MDIDVKFDDRGSLIPINKKDLPDDFGEIKRIMIIAGNEGITRGSHAHYKTKQLLVCAGGFVKITSSFDGEKWETKTLGMGDVFYHPNHQWLVMEFIRDGTIISICSQEHDEKDYIKSIMYFKQLSAHNWNKNKTDAQEEQRI